MVSDSRNFGLLEAHILSLSVSKAFNDARKEWSLLSVEISEEFGKCPCGQQIKEHCYIRNNANGNKTWVGNVCINIFIQLDTGNLFEGLRRISRNPTASANIDVVEYAYERGYLYGENEYLFLLETARKRSLSIAQQAWRNKINRRIINQIIVKKRTDHESGRLDNNDDLV